MIFVQRCGRMVLKIHKAGCDDHTFDVEYRFTWRGLDDSNVGDLSVTNANASRESRFESPINNDAIHQDEILGRSCRYNEQNNYG